MSEDVKPRKYWVDDITERICAPWDHPELGAHKLNWPDNEKVIKVIELEPTMRMMDELAEAISNWKKQVETYGGDYLPGNYNQLSNSLEKYKKFKEVLK